MAAFVGGGRGAGIEDAGRKLLDPIACCLPVTRRTQKKEEGSGKVWHGSWTAFTPPPPSRGAHLDRMIELGRVFVAAGARSASCLL